MESIFNIQNQYLEQSATLVEMKKKKNSKSNPLIQTLAHWSNLYHYKIYQKIFEKIIQNYSGTKKKYDLPDTLLSFPFGNVG